MPTEPYKKYLTFWGDRRIAEKAAGLPAVFD
jgi:hypothetical protein|nr:MAG TPA: hypothetical protein [Caudoviricetes sp.]